MKPVGPFQACLQEHPMELLAVNLDLVGILVVSTVGTIGVLLVSYAIAGWYERRARRRRQAQRRA